jgi:hypothetical protein
MTHVEDAFSNQNLRPIGEDEAPRVIQWRSQYCVDRCQQDGKIATHQWMTEDESFLLQSGEEASRESDAHPETTNDSSNNIRL